MKRTKIESELRRLMDEIALLPDQHEYGVVRQPDGHFRVYTVESVRFLLREAQKYLDDGEDRQAAEIVAFVESIYKG